MDFSKLPDISNFSITGQNLDPFAFDPAKYASIEEVSAFLKNRRLKATKIDLECLAISGIAKKDSFETYLSESSNSSSKLKQILITPRHYQVYDEELLPKRASSAFDFGTFCHLAFLEPKKFKTVIPEGNFSRASVADMNEALRFYKAFLSNRKLARFDRICEHEGIPFSNLKIAELKQAVDIAKELTGKTFLCIEDYAKIKLIEQNYKAYGNGLIPRILKGASFETSFYTYDPETLVPVKVRPDAFNLSENIGVNAVISFKTTSAPNLERFWYDTAKYSYEVSEAMYLKVLSDVTGRNFNAVITIMLQSIPPYLPAVFFWSAEDLNLGRLKYEKALKLVRKYRKLNLSHWPGYDSLSKSALLAANLPNSAFTGFKTFDENE